MTKRLFIFAGYDPQGIIDDTLIYFLTELSKLGDIVFTMDNECTAQEIKKLDAIPNILHANIARHGEYDFGSYKRGFMWAKENDILRKYDWIYLVNDSCYLLRSPDKMINYLENSGHKMTGAVENDKWKHHIQSFFVGLAPEIFTTDWFAGFMSHIHHETKKGTIVLKYEAGLSKLVLQHGFSFKAYSNRVLTSRFYTNEHRRVPLLKKCIITNEHVLVWYKKIRSILRETQQRTNIQEHVLRTKALHIPYSKKQVLSKKIKALFIKQNTSGYWRICGIPLYNNALHPNFRKFFLFPFRFNFSWGRDGYEVKFWGVRLLKLQRKDGHPSKYTIKKYHREHKNNKCRGCVYTCLTGDYDKLPTHRYLSPQYDYICFTDNAELLKNGHAVWQVRPLPFDKGDRVINSRFPKLNPHLVVGEYEHSVYVDANIDIVTNKLFRICEKSSKDIMIPKHNERECLYAEARKVYDLNKDTPENIFKTLAVLHDNGFPQNFGLAENNIIWRKHTPEIQQIDEQWWDMFIKYSKRDQLSLGYVLWTQNRSFQDMYMPIQQGWDYMVYKHEK